MPRRLVSRSLQNGLRSSHRGLNRRKRALRLEGLEDRLLLSHAECIAAATHPDVEKFTAHFFEVIGDGTIRNVAGLRFDGRFETRTRTVSDGVEISDVVTEHHVEGTTDAEGVVKFEFTGPPAYFCEHQDSPDSPLIETGRGTGFRDMTLKDAPAVYKHIKKAAGLDRPEQHLVVDTISSTGMTSRGDQLYCVAQGGCGLFDNGDEFTWQFPIFRPFTVSGRVYNDFNGNGVFDSEFDSLLDDVQIGLFNEQNDRTDTDGTYLLDDLPPGDLAIFSSITLTDPDTWSFTSGQVIPARSGQHLTNWDIGFFEEGTIRGRTFQDENGNGLRDDGEDAIPYVVYLDSNGNGQFDREGDPFSCPRLEHQTPALGYHGEPCRFSDAEGNYEFTSLGRGTYVIRVSAPENTVFTLPANSHEPPAGGCTATGNGQAINMLSGFTFSEVNFGEFVPANIFGRKFLDTDGDGTRDANEPGTPGEIALDLCSDGVIDLRADTDPSGFYSFTGVGPGQHTVVLVQDPKETQTFPAANQGHPVHVTETQQTFGPLSFGTRREGAVVNDDRDVPDADPNDTFCDVDLQQAGLQCTLRAALQFSNSRPSFQTITFDLPGAGTPTISILSPLPEITDTTEIDGGSRRVVLLGGALGNGLTIAAGSTTIRGLTLAGFSGAAIELKGPGQNLIEDNELLGSGAQGLVIREGSTQNTIRKNRIGTDLDRNDRGNEGAGIEVHSESNILGGDSPDDGNIIAYNATGIAIHVGFNRVNSNVVVANREHGISLMDGNNRVQGNRIGVDRDDRPLGNAQSGIEIRSRKNTIGGDDASFGNVVAYNERGLDVSEEGENTIDNNELLANLREGMVLRGGSDQNTVRRNYIGVDRVGFTFGNGAAGIWVASSNNMVGGLEEGSGNVVAFNGADADLVAENPNGGYGIVVAALPGEPASMTGNALFGNRLRRNAGPGIDLGFDGSTANDNGLTDPPVGPDADIGPNGLQNTPELVSLVFENQVVGRLSSHPNTPFRLEFFASTVEDGELTIEGTHFLGALDVTTNASGAATFTVPSFALESEQVLSATASRLIASPENWETSEFSLRPLRDDDTCGNTELQAIKNQQWQAIQSRIDQIAATDPAAAQHVRQLIQRTGRRQEDGCIPVTLERLDSLHDMVITHQQATKDNGWWTDFADLMGSDYDRVSGLMADSWTGFFDELAALYDDPAYRNQQILAFDDFVTSSLHGTKNAVAALGAFIYEHNTDLLFDAAVFLWDNALRAETYHAIASQLFAVESMKKAFDPDVPVEQRIGHMLSGMLEIAGTLEGLGAVGKLAANRAKGAISKLSKEAFEPGSAKELQRHLFQKLDDTLEKGAPSLIRQLKHGARIPTEALHELGYTDEAIAELRRIAKERGVRLQFRTTNVRSVRFLNEGTAVPKRLEMKAKTINDKDVYLGYDRDHEGLVGLRDPATLKNPADTEPCRQNRAELCKAIKERFEQRKEEFEKIGPPKLDPTFELNAEGLVLDRQAVNPATGQLMPVTGDIDPVAFLRPDGTHLSGDEYRALLADLRASGAQIQHGAERRIVEDMKEFWAARCRESLLHRSCIQEGTPEWEEAEKKVRATLDQLRQNHLDGKETTIEFREDGEMYRAIIDALDQAEGESDRLSDLPVDVAEFKQILRNLNVDIRRDRLTTFDQLFGVLTERRDAQAVYAVDLLQRLSPDHTIDEETFFTTTPQEFVELVDAFPSGLRIETAETAGGEGEGTGALSSQAILDKIQTAVGATAAKKYRVESDGNGGFKVTSTTAIEQSLDVNADQLATPIDVLIIFNHLNSVGAGPLTFWPAQSELRKDVNLDRFISPIDSLIIINYLNSAVEASAEGEGATGPIAVATTATGSGGSDLREGNGRPTRPWVAAGDQIVERFIEQIAGGDGGSTNRPRPGDEESISRCFAEEDDFWRQVLDAALAE